MARDGLLPQWAAKVHPKFKTPHVTTILTGIFVGVFAAFANIAEVIDLTNIGTLFAFVIVSAGVLLLHYKEPNRARPFRTPGMPFTPLIAIAACLFLMLQLPRVTWIRFIIWLAVGIVFYFLFGYRHSRLKERRISE
jgi:APA family basic amino acid/polyamine antiporter